MTNKLQDYLKTIIKTNRTLDSYVDWEKVKKNALNHAINLNVLNSLTKANNQKDVELIVNEIFTKGFEDAFESLEILIAKRNDGDREYLLEETLEIKKFSFDSKEEVIHFINETNLLELFKSVKSLDDYVFGVEVGLDTNGRKNRAGKTMELLIRRILEENNISFNEQVDIKTIEGIDSDKKKTKRVDFVFKKNDITYLIESSFYNGKGSKISEVCNSYADLTTKINNDKLHLIWVADGKGMETIKPLLEEQWNNVDVVSIRQFEDMIKK